MEYTYEEFIKKRTEYLEKERLANELIDEITFIILKDLFSDTNYMVADQLKVSFSDTCDTMFLDAITSNSVNTTKLSNPKFSNITKNAFSSVLRNLQQLGFSARNDNLFELIIDL